MVGTIQAPCSVVRRSPRRGAGGGETFPSLCRLRAGRSAKRTLDRPSTGATMRLAGMMDMFPCSVVPAEPGTRPRAVSVKGDRTAPARILQPVAPPGHPPEGGGGGRSVGPSSPSQSIFHAGALVGDHQGLFHDGAMLRGRYRPVPEGPRDIRQGCHRHRRPGGPPLISSCISPDGPRTGRHLSPERVMMRQGRQAHNRAVRPKEKPRECANTPGP